jgi:hypothetical protein
MKKLLLSGITAVALMAAGTAQAGGLDLYGGTGVARTPLAMSLKPMQFQVAAEYVFSDDLFIPVRAAIGLPFGIELGGAYWYIDPDVEKVDVNIPMYDVTAKWVLPKFVENLGLAVGGHYSGMKIEVNDLDYTAKNNGYDVYAVATYIIPMGNGLALIPSGGVWYESRKLESQMDELDQTQDGVKFFGSLLLKHAKFAVGGEYMTSSDGPDGSDTFVFGDDDDNVDGFYWVGGRFFVNPMITLQAGYINNADLLDDEGDLSKGVFHAGVQFAFGGGK